MQMKKYIYTMALEHTFSIGLFIWQFVILINFLLFTISIIRLIKIHISNEMKIVWFIFTLLIPILGPIFCLINTKAELKKQ